MGASEGPITSHCGKIALQTPLRVALIQGENVHSFLLLFLQWFLLGANGRNTPSELKCLVQLAFM